MNGLLSFLAPLIGRWFDKSAQEEENRAAETRSSAGIAMEVERAIGKQEGFLGRAVDAYTRLMRPLILTLSLAGLGWFLHMCYNEPVRAFAFGEAIAANEMIILALLAFPLAHFGIRPFEKAGFFSRTGDTLLRAKQVDNVLALKEKADTEGRLEKEMQDTKKPLSNWAIVEINKRMGHAG